MSNALKFSPPPRQMSEEEFVERFGGIYEHSAWVAEEAWRNGLTEKQDSVDGLAAAMGRVVDQAETAKKGALINAHPDLAGKLAVSGGLTEHSTAEQASAGIDQCSPEEFDRFQALNDAYKERFGMVFIMAVKGSNREEILAAFEARVTHSPEEEFERAIREIHKIARLRLLDIAALPMLPTVTKQIKPVRDKLLNPLLQWVDLAQPRLGTRVVYATDDFFADKSRLIEPQEPVWIDDKYDDHGKWMDGWESRRKRVSGHDFAVIKLGVPGRIHGVDIDTRFFTGNYPPEASVDVCVSAEEIPGEDANWTEAVPRMALTGDSHHYVDIIQEAQYTHVRLNIFPDGGVARLRVYGEIMPDWSQVGDDEQVDLVALTHGGKAIICNDEHYGSMRNLNAPGHGVNMGDGWETARRREAGNDWVILALGHPGVIQSIHIDTAHFKGNYPDKVSIQAVNTTMSYPPDLAKTSGDWPRLLPGTKLEADRLHEFSREITGIGPVTHVRINIFPDGGLSRVRLFGVLSRDTE